MLKNTLTITVLSVLIAACGGGSGAGADTPPAVIPPITVKPYESKLNSELAAIVNDAARPLSALSVLAIKGGQVEYQNHLGWRYIDASNSNSNLAANADTLYRIASVSKWVTAIGVMKLVEQGKLNLDVDASQYLGFQLRNPNFPTSVITTRMLLNHTASLRDGQGYTLSVSQTLQSLLVPGGTLYGGGGAWAKPASSGDFAPGKYFHYGNLNYGVLGTIVEGVSKQRFDRYMGSVILAPLGIRGGFNPADLSAADIGNVATLYRKQTGGVWNSAGPWVAQVDNYLGVIPAQLTGLGSYTVGRNGTLFSPQGGLRISLNGLAKLTQLMLNRGEIGGVRLLNGGTVDLMLSEQWRMNAAPVNGNDYGGLFNAWGLGTQRFIDRTGNGVGDRVAAQGGYTGWGHLGDSYGLLSGVVFNPADQSALIYVISGTGSDPAGYLNSYSAFYKWEALVLDSLYRRALLGQSN